MNKKLLKSTGCDRDYLPRFGFPFSFNRSSKFSPGINLLNSVKTSLALRLKTDQDVQWSMKIRWAAEDDPGIFFGDSGFNLGFFADF